MSVRKVITYTTLFLGFVFASFPLLSAFLFLIAIVLSLPELFRSIYTLFFSIPFSPSNFVFSRFSFMYRLSRHCYLHGIVFEVTPLKDLEYFTDIEFFSTLKMFTTTLPRSCLIAFVKCSNIVKCYVIPITRFISGHFDTDPTSLFSTISRLLRHCRLRVNVVPLQDTDLYRVLCDAFKPIRLRTLRILTAISLAIALMYLASLSTPGFAVLFGALSIVLAICTYTHLVFGSASRTNWFCANLVFNRNLFRFPSARELLDDAKLIRSIFTSSSNFIVLIRIDRVPQEEIAVLEASVTRKMEWGFILWKVGMFRRASALAEALDRMRRNREVMFRISSIILTKDRETMNSLIAAFSHGFTYRPCNPIEVLPLLLP
ncbi:MAG: hypothetical protein DRJ40_10785 [Thermoprotei archaeon]|nr:MAG: hypothetical protein DRJ40_10785 [Thermoprotei archaeon]